MKLDGPPSPSNPARPRRGGDGEGTEVVTYSLAFIAHGGLHHTMDGAIHHAHPCIRLHTRTRLDCPPHGITAEGGHFGRATLARRTINVGDTLAYAHAYMHAGICMQPRADMHGAMRSACTDIGTVHIGAYQEHPAP